MDHAARNLNFFLHVFPLRAVNHSAVQPGDLALTVAQSGEESFERILELYEPQVARTAWRLLGRTGEAQDATQEVLLRLYRNYERLAAGTNLAAWLYTVTVNVCRDAMRRRPPFVLLDRDVVSPDAGPDGASEFEQRKRIVAEALGRLTHQERECITLHDIEGLSTREVAAAIGCTEATVRSHLSTGRARLKEIVQRRRT